MFIYSVKAQSIKFFGAVVLSCAVLAGLILFVPTLKTSGAESTFTEGKEISYDNVKTDEDRRAFLSQFGWQVKGDCIEEKTVTIPDEFDKIYSGYNDIQKSQGLNLEKYKRKEVTSYTYELTEYPDYDGVVYANLLVYRDSVIGGDICSADSDGFVAGFERPDA